MESKNSKIIRINQKSNYQKFYDAFKKTALLDSRIGLMVMTTDPQSVNSGSIPEYDFLLCPQKLQIINITKSFIIIKIY